jgi:hypothetical protein
VTARAPGALSSAAAAALVVIAGLLGDRALLIAVAVMQAVVAFNWRAGVGVRGIGHATVLAWLAGAGAAGAIAWDLGPAGEPLLPVVVLLGVGFLGLIVVQLYRRHPRKDATAGMAAASVLLVVLVLGAVWLDVFAVLGGRRAVVVGAVPVVVAAFGRLLPLPWSVPAAVLLGAVSGAALGVGVPVKGDPIGIVAGAVLGALAGSVVALQALLTTRAEPSGPGRRTKAQADAWLLATAAFAVFVAAPLVYPVLRIAVG